MALAAAPPAAAHQLALSVCLTVLYSDVFGAALRVDELHRFLPEPCPDRNALDSCLAELTQEVLTVRQGLVCWRGHETLLVRHQERHALAEPRWQVAQRFAVWLGWVPFLRMVAVCGSQAVENGDQDGDLDLFLITDPGRLWLVQAMTMVLRRLGRWRLGTEICPNFLLQADCLELAERNLYTAREIVQAVPLWGADPYQDFLAQNAWIADFLPQLDPRTAAGRDRLRERQRFLRAEPQHRLTRLLAAGLRGRWGAWLERRVHRALLSYYRFRWRDHGIEPAHLAAAYRPDRQLLLRGGYASAVARALRDRVTTAFSHDPQAAALVARWFPRLLDADADSEASPVSRHSALFASRYGGVHE